MPISFIEDGNHEAHRAHHEHLKPAYEKDDIILEIIAAIHHVV